MYNFLKIQYEMGVINKEELYSFVPKWITEHQAQMIINNKARVYSL